MQLVAYTLYDIPNICTKLTSAIAAGKPGQGGGQIIQHRETRAEVPKKKDLRSDEAKFGTKKGEKKMTYDFLRKRQKKNALSLFEKGDKKMICD